MASRRKKFFRVFKYLILICSILLIVYITLWRSTGGIHEVRWNPVRQLIAAFKAGKLCRDDILNTLLFVPFGFSLNLFSVKRSRAVLFGFLLSLFVETVQLTLHIGWFETEDMLMNTLGTFCGYMLSNFLFRKMSKTEH